MNTQRKSIWLATSLATALAAVLLVPMGASAHDPLDGGKTTLKLDAGVAEALADAGVAVTPIKPAKAKGSGVSFPIVGGTIASGKLGGEIEHSGGLRFAVGGTKLDAKSFTIELGKKPKLTAEVGNDRVKLLKLDPSKAKLTNVGLNTKISGVTASLTAPAAKALNATFDTDLFARGIVIGKTTTIAEPASVKLGGGDTALTLDPAAASALSSLGVTPAPIAPASANPDGSLAFPITGGRLDLASLGGKIRHDGGISLSKGSTVVELTKFDIQVDEAPDLTALLGGTRASILDLDVSALETSVTDRTIGLAGVTASLTQGAADALNAAFGTTAFTPGLVLGTTVTAAEAK